MKKSIDTSTVMHKRYLDLKKEDVAAAFGTGAKSGRHKNGGQGANSNGQERASA